jgi:hypothetical protein
MGYIAQNWISLGSILPSSCLKNEEIYLFATLDLEPSNQNIEASEPIHVHFLKWR